MTLWLAYSNASLAAPVGFDAHHDSIVIQAALAHSTHAGISLNILAASPATALRSAQRVSPADFFLQRKCSPALKAQIMSDLNLWLGVDLRLTRSDIDAGYASSWCARITVVNGTVYSLDPKPHLQMTNGAEHWFYSMLSETLAHMYATVAHTHLIDVTRLSHDAEKVEFNARLSCEHVQPAAVASVHYTLSPLPQSAPANVPANAAVEISRLPLQEGLVAGVSSTIISNMLHAFPIFRGPRGAFLPSIVLLSCPRAAAAASASATALQPTETA